MVQKAYRFNNALLVKNIEKSLKYDPQNEETLEIGIAASLLGRASVLQFRVNSL